MNGSIRVGNLFGIPFYVHPSWFLILLLVTWNFGSSLAVQFSGLGPGLPWLLGAIAALLMFASVLAHELGHSFVAIAQGIQVRSITLFLFGGLASLEAESKSAAGAFWVAIAGPIVSLVLFGLLTAVGVVFPIPAPLAAIVGLLAYINLILGLFNLIPGLPLDGGNILKALVWKITGNPYKGVRFASRVGQFFGWFAIGTGVLSLIRPSLQQALLPMLRSPGTQVIALIILGLASIGSVWTALIGLFLLQNAGRMAQSATVQEQLMNLTAADAIVPDSPMVKGTLSLRQFVNDSVIGRDRSWKRFLVTDDAGQLLGAIALDDLKTIPTDEWPKTLVQELVKPLGEVTSIQADQPLLDAIKLLEESQKNELLVTGENDVLIGLLEKASIARLLQEQAQTNSVKG